MFNKVKRPYFLNEFNMTKISSFKKVDFYKRSYLVSNDDSIRMLRFPGFSFSSDIDAIFYYNSFYKDIENSITPPRGNLTRNSKYAFVGIKPGSFERHGFSEEDISECCWLFGPSSKYLNNLLLEKKIYPYFTNVYRTYRDEINSDIFPFLDEMKIIKDICNEIIFVFMGSYADFDKIIDEAKLKSYEYKKIWHPSYIARKGGKNFNEWSRRF